MRYRMWSGVVCLAAVSAISSAFPLDSEELSLITHSDGYDFATLHVVDSTTQEEIRLSKQDLKDHAADLSTNERTYSLHLTSGQILRMSVSRFSIDTSASTFTELSEEGEERKIDVDLSECFFSGPLDNEEGFASISICDGKLVGYVAMPDRDYQIHVLPYPDDVMQVLVTWKDNEQGLYDGNHALDIPEDFSSIPIDKRSGPERHRVTIELCDALDMYYLADIKRKLGITSTSDIIQLLISKWSTVAHMLSNMSQAGWDMDLRLVKVFIMRSRPDWYTAQPGEKVGARLNEICKPTRDWKCDYIVLHTGRTKYPSIRGRTWQSAMCNLRYRCSAEISSDRGYMVELHEMGHSLGIKHEVEEPRCQEDSDPVRGFMMSNRFHFRNCYKEILAESFSSDSKKCLFTNAVTNASEIIKDFGPVIHP